MLDANNQINLTGRVFSSPEYSHTLYGEAFYRLILNVDRLSGASDSIPVTVSERLLCGIPLEEGSLLSLSGQIRSYNQHSENGNRLTITVFALEISREPDDSAHFNEAVIEGHICKPVVYRTTPFSREIADILLAVNRRYGKSDYLPCIAWGRNARFVRELGVGSKIHISGRLQSREYQKCFADGRSETRMAYEVSCSTIEEL